LVSLLYSYDSATAGKIGNILIENKRSVATQTLRAGCSKDEPKKIRPVADPLPGEGDGTAKI